MIFNWLRDKTPDAAYAAYTALVGQARLPVFYMKTQVPDTLDGRFDMIVMHIVLAYRRFHGDGKAPQAFGQHIFDLFIKDMDRSLRESGVGDVSIPKKMKKVARSYFGRSEVYISALDDADLGALAEAVDRNIFPDGSNQQAARCLAAYMIEADKNLAEQGIEELMAGTFTWPDLEKIDVPN